MEKGLVGIVEKRKLGEKSKIQKVSVLESARVEKMGFLCFHDQCELNYLCEYSVR